MSKKAFAVLGLAAVSVTTAVQAQDQVLDGYNDAAFAKAFYRYEFGGANPLTNEHRLGFIANGSGNLQSAPMMEYRQAASGQSSLSMSGMPVRVNGQNVMVRNANGGEVSLFQTAGFWVVVGGTALITGIAIADDDDESLVGGTGGSGGSGGGGGTP
jgi:hypothetical protein